MAFVIDSSAIFSGHIPFDKCYITPEIEVEVKDLHSSKLLSSYICSGKIIIVSPKSEFISEVKKTISGTGDSLSDADISILALANEIGATIVTDDYGIQNIASVMGLDVISAKTKGIEKEFIWGRKCIGCGKKYPLGKEMVCEVCGSPLRRYVKKRSKRGRP